MTTMTDTRRMPGRAGLGRCRDCGERFPVRAGGTIAAHGACPGSGQPPAEPVPCAQCGRTGLALTRGLCAVCRTGTGDGGQEWRQPSEDPGRPVLLLARLAGQPATAYYVTNLGLAERLVADAEGSGDTVAIRSVREFAAAQAVAADVKPGQLHLLGIQRDDGRWVEPSTTGQARQRN
jgi:hypothetical protein